MQRSTSTRRARATVTAVAGLAGLAASVTATTAPSGAIVPGLNGKIAFESSRDGNNEIYGMNSDGTIETRLTDHPASDVFPAWSPAGDRITFSSDRAQAGNADVYVMNADGTGVTRLTNAPGEDRGTSWTSDGQMIVFHSARFRDASHAFDVFTMNADGTNQTKVFHNGSAAYVCGDSVTGRIVFNSNRDGNFEIYTMNLDGTGLVQVTNTAPPVLNSGPKWSPDCNTIAFNQTDAGGSLDVHRINADGTGQVNLTNAPGVFDAFAAWSPDNTRIVFSSNRDVNFEIYAMDAANGANVTRYTFTKKGEADLRADWGTAPNTYGPPTTKEQCRKGGWAEFQTPTFANESECVSTVASGQPVNDA